MKRVFFLWILILFDCCSSDAPEPDAPVMPGGAGEEEQVDVPPETGKIPFAISVVLKEYSGVSNEGAYYSVNFPKGATQPAAPVNISQAIGLRPDAISVANGMEDILVFNYVPERSFTAYYTTTGETISGTLEEFFPNREECFITSNQTAWNTKKVFAFEAGGCGDPGSIRLMARDLESGVVTELSMLENAHTGDTPHGIWANEAYFFVLYDDLTPATSQTYQDGLVVYDAHSYERVFSIVSPAVKSVYADGNRLFISSRLDSVRLIELTSPETGITQTPDPSIPVHSRVRNTSVYNTEIGTLLGEFNYLIPAAYNIFRNEYSYVDREKYLAFFNRDTTDFAAEVLRPEEFVFNMETGTFAITYLIFDPGESQPKSSAIVFMDFDGNVLFIHQFPPSPFLPVRVITG